MDTTTIPVTGVEELDLHLDQLMRDSSLALDAKLFDHVQLQLTESNIPPLIPLLLPKLVAILQQDDRDPALPASLATRLLSPVTFTQSLTLASEESLIHALSSPEPSVNLLAMTVLEKAARTADDAALLADMPQLFAELLRRWLLSPHAQVGAKGRRVLGDLLDTDSELPPLPPPPPSTGQAQGGQDQVLADMVKRRVPGRGKLWRLLFRTREPYQLLVDICSGRHPGTAPADGHQLSLAQGRLLDILPRLAVLDFHAVAASDFAAGRPTHATNGGVDHDHDDDHEEPGPDQHQQRRGGGGQQHEGLLQFAALRMVDRRDALMHLNLVEFMEGFVSLMRVAPERSPYKVETLRALLRGATADEDGGAALRAALLGLPDRTVPEEADDLRLWLREVLPGEAVRVAGGHWG
ncbi:hypothetical protein QBC33DRAFT_454292 [Phialemonium atrogriseum]|uniref:DNA mismatch repair protein HSM3 N-terminal domain-containing protein n=1 Tax=Phialemonium atrogriseum TaxID=1093897 RepID=A0AAJ0BXU2_9PEZI|nr:uncharacterized protein QBC33DRAFT_454292 [Phialemonium atrogriseum]KAK1765857.1 hypothetical protein QBC33DRAFT_454292 [Phialemonium atrogriseum]